MLAGALLFSGLSQALIAPPLGWIVLHPVSWVPALAAFSRLDARRAFRAGWLVGASAALGIFYWIVPTIERFSNLGLAAALAVLAAFAAAAGLHVGVFAWGCAPVRRASGAAWPFGVAAWFTACEFLDPQLFPFYQGVAWYQEPRVFLLCALTGISGVTFLVLLANALVLAAWETRGRPPRRVLAAGAAVLAAALAWSALRERRVRAAEAAAPRLRLALVQTNHDVETRRALARRGPRAVAEDCVSLSREALARGPVDAFVWPEGELRGGPDEPGNRPALDFARESGAAIWTGSNIFEPAGARNSALRLAADGASGRYDKTLLLPFGEFMPLAERFPILRRIKGVGRFSPGDGPRVFEDARARPAPLICYEAIRPGFVRAAFRRGADLLVNVTYDAWFGRTSCPYQHLMLAAVQSAQLGVPLARCATTGLSAVVDARGVIRARTALFTREILRADLPLVRLGSPYAALGPWFAWCCVAASAVLLARGLPRA